MLKAGFQLRPCWTRCVARGFAGARSVTPSPASVLWLRDGGRVISGPGRTSSFRLGVGANESVLVFRRRFAGGGGEGGEELRNKRRATVMFISALGVLVLSLSYAAVPLYRLFCQATSYGGTVLERDDADLSGMKKRADRKIRIAFNADTAANLTWSFRPQQTEITVSPGETALAFYTATNKTDKPIDGIATYNVIPFEVGQYFNKIQCFCFEEQRLNPGEQVDMPVFFYIDPEFAEDPKMEYIKDVTLSYTFFEAKEGLNLPMPAFMNKS